MLARPEPVIDVSRLRMSRVLAQEAQEAQEVTSPDGASPSGASGYANVGDLQDVTQETVDGLYRTPLQDKIATQQGDALNWIMAPVNALGSAIFQGWFGVSRLPDQSAALKGRIHPGGGQGRRHQRLHRAHDDLLGDLHRHRRDERADRRPRRLGDRGSNAGATFGVGGLSGSLCRPAILGRRRARWSGQRRHRGHGRLR